MQDILQAMIDDFDSRWGDGEDINKYTLGTIGTNKGQPCGYTKGQVLCFTLDPRMETLPQVPEEQEEDVWRVLEVRCKELMFMQNHHSLRVLTSLKTVKPRICWDARSHLKWCRQLTLRLTKTWSMSSSLPRRSVLETPIF
jgi:hypothetical protein